MTLMRLIELTPEGTRSTALLNPSFVVSIRADADQDRSVVTFLSEENKLSSIVVAHSLNEVEAKFNACFRNP